MIGCFRSPRKTVRWSNVTLAIKPLLQSQLMNHILRFPGRRVVVLKFINKGIYIYRSGSGISNGKIPIKGYYSYQH